MGKAGIKLSRKRSKQAPSFVDLDDPAESSSSISRYHYHAEDLRMPFQRERINQSDLRKPFPNRDAERDSDRERAVAIADIG